MPRQDVKGDFALKQILVNYMNKQMYYYELKNKYFYKKDFYEINSSVPEEENHFLRLCLKEVQKKGANIKEPAHVFDYYRGAENSILNDIVPPRECFAQDYFGYYNQSSVIDINSPNPSKESIKEILQNHNIYRQSMSGSARNGILRTYKNPFGGCDRI